MLAVAVSAPLRRSDKDEQQGEEETTENSKYYDGGQDDDDELLGDHELSLSLSPSPQGSFLLESITFDDLFAGIDDVLPDLEMDPADLFPPPPPPPDFSSLTSSTGPDDHRNNNNTSGIISIPPDGGGSDNKSASSPSSSSDSDSGGSISKGDEITVVMMSKRDDHESLLLNPSPTNNNNHNNEISDKGRKSSSSKNPPTTQGKKKVKKVDWTPELHRRFVQAVEQLGVDKAVPSRILEVMGIHCLTRHNIASHLQKYRSHRKHLLAREAEAASWSQRRQMLQGKRSEGSPPWVAPTIGFPPMPMPMPMPMPHFRPSLHVWGHPTPIDHQPLLHIWPKPNSPSPPAWAPPPPNSDPSFWHHPRGPNALALTPTPGAPCYPRPPLTTTRFGCPTPTTTTTTVAAPTAGVPPPPHAMYKLGDPGIALPARQPPPPPLSDFHPSKESVDAAIGDVLSKPWLPLPLGLKAPAIESVMGELQRQGIPKVPPSCA